MQRHTKIYMDYFGYGEQDFIPCELGCGRCVDVHHINGRGKDKDVIENLIGLCRDAHVKAHSGELSKEYLQRIHNRKLKLFNLQ